jgi:putative N6-adenine-specific DNA methylase
MHGFISSDECTLYLDTSGAPLYQRGFRQKSVEAPFKENLAAGILRLSGWQPGMPLLDPMCGSGTFLIEAAQMALAWHRAPGGISLSSGCVNFDSAAWKRLLDAARAGEKPLARMPEFSAATFRRWRCALRSPTSTVPGCCPRSACVRVICLTSRPLLAAASWSAIRPTASASPDHDELAAFYPLLGQALNARLRRLELLPDQRRHPPAED